MLTNVMDFDPRITSDVGQGWQYNFHFGYGHDLIEEDAVNEKSCVQALRCLIAKSNAEIHDLEDELAILQCQLKWADPTEKGIPYEVCCDTFKRKIDVLTETINNVRNRNLLNEHDMDATVKIERPAERICDIISALAKQKFSPPDEQAPNLFLLQWHMENLSYEANSVVNSGSVDIGMDRKQKEPTSESAVDSKEFTADVESLCKHADTFSEESCSDIARYTIREIVEAQDEIKTVEVIEETEVYATAEGIHGLLGYSKANNNNGNPTPIALQHEDNNEECMTGSKDSTSDSSPISTEAKVILKVEEDNNDMSIQHIDADSLCKTQQHESDFPIDAHQEFKEFESLSVDDVQITYERKKSLNLQNLGLQRKTPGGVRQNNVSLMQKPKGMIGKREFNSNVTQNLVCQRLPASVTQKNQSLLLGDKKRKLAGAITENYIESEEANDPTENVAPKSKNELVMCLESPRIVEGRAFQLDPSHAGPHDAKSNSTTMEDAGSKGSISCDIESLKLEFSKDPDCLKKLKVAQLKGYLKLYNVPKLSKFKKEHMIDELSKQLRTA